MNRPELLAPAGNMEKLRIAVHYGADAVYIGGKDFSLRAMADNFTLPELAEAVAYARDHGVRTYLAVNTYAGNEDLAPLARYLQETAPIPFDACIVTDPGVLEMVREITPQRPIHLSTQANTTNWRSVLFWQRQGVTRINLARELSLEEIRTVRERTSVELEAFVHGAMCISYSGRCLLSSVMTDRSANRGECAHPCRWNYSLVEEQRPGEYFPIEEDAKGTFIFNSKDLCLLGQLPDLVESGLSALKIEGRMKGIFYLATVVSVYRRALDTYLADPGEYRCRPEWFDELRTISHRGYTTGFLLGQPRDVDHEYRSRYVRSHQLVGVVEEMAKDGTGVVGIRNRLAKGDPLELFGPGLKVNPFVPEWMVGEDGTPLSAANPNQRVRMPLPPGAAPLDLLRRNQNPQRS